MKVLGIETSCDETAAAVVDDSGKILSNIVLSQIEEHRVFGGVVPEIAARAHADYLDKVIKAAMDDAGIGFDEIDGVAATCGPGLVGGVMVGMVAGKSVSAAMNLPFVAVNHLEAHVLTPRLTEKGLGFPYLVLLVSGGHTQILVAVRVGEYHLLGTTIDDAAGECFDKSAKLMGLGYPGGPRLEEYAGKCRDGNRAVGRFALPAPMKGRAGCDFSFSGLKTAVRCHVDKLPDGDLEVDDVADLSFALQESICDVIGDRCSNAIDVFLRDYKLEKPCIAVCGGVGANRRIRETLEHLAESNRMGFVAPPLNLCSDNGAMVAWAGIERLKQGMVDSLDTVARPRWELDTRLSGKEKEKAKGEK